MSSGAETTTGLLSAGAVMAGVAVSFTNLWSGARYPVRIPAAMANLRFEVAPRAALAALALAALLPLAACSAEAQGAGIPGGGVLVQEQDFQAFYDAEGHLTRLLQDRNHDGRAEVVILYYPNGRPERAEIDTDDDGVVDRWEYYRTDGTLREVALCRDHDGVPDAWESVE